MVSATPSWLYAFSQNVLVAYYIRAEVVDRLRADLDLLRKQVASGEWQRDECVAELSRLLTEFAPIPPRLDQGDRAADGSDQPVLVSTQ